MINMVYSILFSLLLPFGVIGSDAFASGNSVDNNFAHAVFVANSPVFEKIRTDPTQEEGINDIPCPYRDLSLTHNENPLAGLDKNIDKLFCEKNILNKPKDEILGSYCNCIDDKIKSSGVTHSESKKNEMKKELRDSFIAFEVAKFYLNYIKNSYSSPAVYLQGVEVKKNSCQPGAINNEFSELLKNCGITYQGKFNNIVQDYLGLKIKDFEGKSIEDINKIVDEIEINNLKNLTGKYDDSISLHDQYLSFANSIKDQGNGRTRSLEVGQYDSLMSMLQLIKDANDERRAQLLMSLDDYALNSLLHFPYNYPHNVFFNLKDETNNAISEKMTFHSNFLYIKNQLNEGTPESLENAVEALKRVVDQSFMTDALARYKENIGKFQLDTASSIGNCTMSFERIKKMCNSSLNDLLIETQNDPNIASDEKLASALVMSRVNDEATNDLLGMVYCEEVDPEKFVAITEKSDSVYNYYNSPVEDDSSSGNKERQEIEKNGALSSPTDNIASPSTQSLSPSSQSASTTSEMFDGESVGEEQDFTQFNKDIKDLQAKQLANKSINNFKSQTESNFNLLPTTSQSNFKALDKIVDENAKDLSESDKKEAQKLKSNYVEINSDLAELVSEQEKAQSTGDDELVKDLQRQIEEANKKLALLDKRNLELQQKIAQDEKKERSARVSDNRDNPQNSRRPASSAITAPSQNINPIPQTRGGSSSIGSSTPSRGPSAAGSSFDQQALSLSAANQNYVNRTQGLRQDNAIQVDSLQSNKIVKLIKDNPNRVVYVEVDGVTYQAKVLSINGENIEYEMVEVKEEDSDEPKVLRKIASEEILDKVVTPPVVEEKRRFQWGVFLDEVEDEPQTEK